MSAAEPAYDQAHAAIEALRALGLTPNAVNVALWTAHIEGENEALSEDLVRQARAPLHATPEQLRALYVKYLMPGSDQALSLQDLVDAPLRKASSALAQANHDVSRYGQALRGVVSALEGPISAPAVKALIAGLAQATEHMRAKTQELERKLAETKSEVVHLQHDLTKVREEAASDPLTGLANRKRFDEFLDRRLRDASDGAPLSLIVCDIDHFKRVNDTWGHATGDCVIQFVASVLGAQARPEHLAARIGGEEFAIVAPGADAAECAKLAEAARCAIASKRLKRRSTGEDIGLVTASFGVAELQAGEDALGLVERADRALYASKHDGRNRVSCAA